MYREASQRPKSPIVVVGMLMLVGPMLLFSVYGLFSGAVELFHRPNQFEWWTVLFFAFLGVLAYVSGTLLLRTFENFQNHANAAKPADDGDEDENAEEWWDEAEGAPDEEDDRDADAKS
jgi:hypothetical protein